MEKLRTRRFLRKECKEAIVLCTQMRRNEACMKTVQITDAGFTKGWKGQGEAVAKEASAKENAMKEKEKTPSLKDGAVFAGSLNLMNTDRIEKRRSQAREQAARMIRDQFATDNRLTDIIEEQRDLIKKLGEERSDKFDEVRKYNDKQAGLMEQYGITQDSEEQKNLDLLRKAIKLREQHRLGDLSNEEVERLSAMGPVTEYQERSLSLDEIRKCSEKRIENINKETALRIEVIGDIRQGMLAQHGMTCVQKASARILDAASGDMIGMMMEDAKKSVDEKMKELVEAAKEAAEKKKTEEKRTDRGKDAQEEQEDLEDKVQESVSLEEDIEEQIKKILEQAKLLLEERKGLVVSEQV